ncbi:MAG: UvrD-helicase domain-containing protein [Halieaceae bacterium]|nr:UvrD-helicase domain-containing protein [Halieaceae bacterium]
MPDRVVDQQARESALDPLRSFCVTAPAGSGKTELLIQRYLTLLARVPSPQAVLAITFTRKAAAEMQSRVVAALLDAHTGAPAEDPHQAKTSELAAAALRNSDQHGWNLLQNPAQLNIRTIDGFCSLLTRQLPLLSRFGGAVSAVDDATPLYREATELLLQSVVQQAGTGPDLRRLLLLFNNNWNRLRELLEGMLARRDQWLLSLGTGLDTELDTGEAANRVEASLDELTRDYLQTAAASIASFSDTLLPLWQYRCDNLGLEAVTARLPSTEAAALPKWRSLAETLLTAKGELRRTVDKRSGFPAGDEAAKDQRDRMLALLRNLAEQPDVAESVTGALADVLALPMVRADDTAWGDILACTRLLPRLAAALTVVFQQQGSVDHTQVALAALEALGPDESPTELSLKLDYQLEHILVDEFQDTAVAQYRLLERLTRGWEEHNASNGQSPRTLFIVGDGMQSIYGFRDADVSLFIRAKQFGLGGIALAPLLLQTNFRSRAGVVDWNNRVFGEAFPKRDDIHRGEIAFSPATAFDQRIEPAPVRVLAFESAVAEAAWVADAVQKARHDDPEATIAVLVRRKADLLPLIPALKARSLTWLAQDIDRLADVAVVRDLENLCRALYNPTDRVAWLALLRAPWCGLTLNDLHAVACHCTGASLWADIWHTGINRIPLSPDGATRLEALVTGLAPVVQYLDRYNLRDAVEEAWLRLRGPECVEDRSSLENAQAFLSMLADMEDDAAVFDPARLADAVSRLFASSSDPDSDLSLMTLHKAKGLEFDHVFIPNLAHSTRAESRPLLLWDQAYRSDGGSGLLLALNQPAGDAGPGVYDFLYRQRKAQRAREATRLLYVGATRAARQLCLSATLSRDDDGSWKAPGSNSLLATVWPSIADEIQEQTVPDIDEGVGGKHVSILTRLHSVAAAREAVSWHTPEEEGSDANLPAVPNLLATAIGTLVHAGLERLSLAPLPDDVADWTPWWLDELQQMGLVGSVAREAAVEINRQLSVTLGDERGRWCLDCAQHMAKSEWRLSGISDDGSPREYVIDRCFVFEDTCWVIDYKTGMPAEGEPLADFLQRQALDYRPQLQRYRELLAALREQPVRAALYFTGVAAWVELD